MAQKLKFFFGAAIFFFSVINPAFNSSNTPPLRYTNAPGESNCASCHSGTGNPNFNTDNIIALNFNGNNPTYQSGNSYNVSFINSDATKSRFGFEMTALDVSNTAAGDFIVTNSNNTQRGTSSGRIYIHHKSANANNLWNFQWQAPATDVGDVMFYVSSVAGNSNNSSSGDAVYVDTFIIRSVPPTIANFTASTNSVCSGTSVIFTDNSSSDANSWSWNFGSGSSPAVATGKGPHTVVYNTSGQKNISLTVTGNTGQVTETKNNFITVNALPNASAGNNVSICAGGQIQLSASGGASYQWSPSNNLSAINVANPIASPTATTTYTVTVTDANNCSASAQVTVTVNSLPAANAGSNVTVCNGGSAQLNASGGVNYLWNNDATLSNLNIANPIATPTATTTYTVSVTNANGCTASDTVTVSVSNILAIAVSPDTALCEGESVLLFASGGNTFSWSPATTLNDSTIANPLANPTENTMYKVTVSDGVCADSATVFVRVDEPLIADIIPDTTIVSSGALPQIQLYASGGNSYTWLPADGLNNSSIDAPILDLSALNILSDTTLIYSVEISEGTCSEILSVAISVQFITPVFETIREGGISVFPNPASENIFIRFENGLSAESVSLFNPTGQLLNVLLVKKEDDMAIDIRDLSSGIYFLNIRAGEQVIHRKVMVK